MKRRRYEPILGNLSLGKARLGCLCEIGRQESSGRGCMSFQIDKKIAAYQGLSFLIPPCI